MSQHVTYRCICCGKRLRYARGLQPAQLRHMLGAPEDPRNALLCGFFIHTKDALHDVREVWRDLDRRAGLNRRKVTLGDGTELLTEEWVV